MKVTTTVQVNLALTVEEAQWLHGLMQNPLSENDNPDFEDPYDRKMREAFYKATAIKELDQD